MKINIRPVLYLLCCVGVGFGFGWAGKTYVISVDQRSNKINEVRKGGFTFINPLLECDTEGLLSSNSELNKVKKKISVLVDEKISQGQATDVSVYYRDLNNGPWFGINEKTDFAPASLLKVPVMMAYFKKAETNPELLWQKIPFSVSTLPQQNITSQKEPSEELGESYTVNDYIEKMIIDSDNQALVILEKNISNDLIDNITLDLDIETIDDTTPDNYMSVKSYASLFRILYNASYLNKEFSEKSLSILSQVPYEKGLRAGVSSDIAIAHKYGERFYPDSGVKQLHDCGIIYYPNNPYLLCVMTKGKDYDVLGSVIGSVSKTIFEELKEYYPSQ